MRPLAYLLLPLVLLAAGCADPNTRVDETYESAINNPEIESFKFTAANQPLKFRGGAGTCRGH